MIRSKAKNIIPLALLLSAFIVSCNWFVFDNPEGYSPAKGYITGIISIGPICPVETNPPDSNCLPTAETYKSWATAIYTPGKKRKVLDLMPDLSGVFTDSLPAGSYIIDFDSTIIHHIGGNNLPMDIRILAGDTLHVSVMIDTGIR